MFFWSKLLEYFVQAAMYFNVWSYDGTIDLDIPGYKQLSQSPPGNKMVPYTGSNSSLNHNNSNTSLRDLSDLATRQRRPSNGNDEACSRQRSYSSGCYEDSPAHTMTFAQSPPNMEGPIMFVAPELAEETLMDVRNIVVSFWNILLFFWFKGYYNVIKFILFRF